MRYFTQDNIGKSMLISAKAARQMYIGHAMYPRLRKKMRNSDPYDAWAEGQVIGDGSALTVWGEEIDDKTLFARILAGKIRKVDSDA